MSLLDDLVGLTRVDLIDGTKFKIVEAKDEQHIKLVEFYDDNKHIDQEVEKRIVSLADLLNNYE